MPTTWNSMYFTEDELRCQCGCGAAAMDISFMRRLNHVRRELQEAMIISSGYRCPAHNAAVSKTGATGPHTTGHAADIRIYGWAAASLVGIARQLGMSGIGVKQSGPISGRFIHLDDLPNQPWQPRPWIWSY